MTILIKKGSTDVVLYGEILDSTAFTPETGITITDLDMQYTRNLSASAAKIDAIISDDDETTHVDDKIKELDATSSPGLYMYCFPDAAFLTGVDKVTFMVTGTGFKPSKIEVQLVDYDPEDAASLGLTTLVNQALIVETGAAVSGTLSTTQMTTDLTNATNNVYAGQVVKFNGDTTTTALQKQAAVISEYDGGLKRLTFSDLTTAPVVGDTFQII